MQIRFNAPDFNLAATLECGQAFRWTRGDDGWYTGVVGREVWKLWQDGTAIVAAGADRGSDEGRAQRARLQKYLALDISLPAIIATFPDDPALRQAVEAHRGLRVLRQEPWETLASFIASSTKQIVQIRQIVAALARRFGEPIADGHHVFPSVEVVARATHAQLLACKLGFRAKYLLAAARMIDSGQVQFAAVPGMEYPRALEELMKMPGVGEKVANCTLLFGCGFDQAFPVDVWVERSVRRLYFPRKKVTSKKVREFTRSRFGPHAGWAQQYLFFAERMRK